MAVRMLFLYFVVALAVALPAKNIYDNASANDVDINSVHLDNNDVTTTKIVQPYTKDTPTSSLPTSTIKVDVKLNNTPTIQNHVGSGFARLIDDIFNIPITVLQSVARLLRNPFKQQVKTPEEASSTY